MAKNFDLEERTAKFGESVIIFCKPIKKDIIMHPLISQIIRSATSVGANYMEVNGASSRKDFRNKIHICKKEIQETKHWLRMISTADELKQEEARKIWNEAQELTLIFGKILSTMNKDNK
jgi:four helix bundle protein